MPRRQPPRLMACVQTPATCMTPPSAAPPDGLCANPGNTHGSATCRPATCRPA
ncbi:MAG: hypothetical protein V4543_06640 [Bacteroidota bacterium]